MSDLLHTVTISSELFFILIIDLAIAIALLTAMRFASGLWAQVNTTEELSQRDNYAFGISLAGSVGALGLVLTGAITGEAADSLAVEALGMSCYGVLGLVLIKAGRMIQDRWALPELSKTEEIQQSNLAVAVVDASNVIATAIVIRAALLWVYGLSIYTLLAILSAFAAAQLVLFGIARLRQALYRSRNQGASLQEALKQGQMAVALRYSGHILGAAMAVQAASHFLIFDPQQVLANLSGWLVFSVIMAVVLTFLSGIAKKVILANINLSEEIDQQQNIGLACLELAISVAIGLLLVGLMA